MLHAWVYALAVEKWSDMAIVIDERQLGRVECIDESLRIASTGWQCLFLPMPHLCTFPNETVRYIRWPFCTRLIASRNNCIY